MRPGPIKKGALLRAQRLVESLQNRPGVRVTYLPRRVAFHNQRDAMIRQLPERLYGPRSGCSLPDDVLTMLRALSVAHPGESKLAEVAEPADAPSRKEQRNATRMPRRADRKRRS